MNYKLITTLFLATTIIFGCKMEEDFDLSPSQELLELIDQNGGKDHFFLPEDGDLGAIPQDPNNPLTPKKIQLGKLLFHETGIATEAITAGGLKTYSCASCHFAGAGFQAGRFQGIGDGGAGFGFNGELRKAAPGVNTDSLDVQPIRSPSTLNVAYQEAMLWNGQFGARGINRGTEAAWTSGTPKETNFLGFEGVEIQAVAGLGVHRLNMTEEIADELGYRLLFDAAFPDIPEASRYSKLYAALAIAAFERSIVANQAPFQNWLRGNPNAMSMKEIRGAVLFFGKGGCVSCHNGPALNSMRFEAQGMNDLVDFPGQTFGTSRNNVVNLGRGGFTGKPEDNYKFKVPQLYSLKRSQFYGHGASFRSLREVIAYKNMGVAENSHVPASALPPSFQPLGLTDTEIEELTAFLTDGLDDQGLRRYQPEGLPSGNCFPNNDDNTRQDIGCN